MMVSLDGYYEGADKNIDWHTVDDEFNAYAIDLLNQVDALLFGRVTYELMASYWPTEHAQTSDPLVSHKMNSLAKIVFSHTLTEVTWENTRLVTENAVEEIQQLKKQPGKDLAIFGSSELVTTLLPYDLIDEYRLIVSPTILGGGNSLFKGAIHRETFNLLSTRTFASGNVLLSYALK